jgi:hypothetical protein
MILPSFFFCDNKLDFQFIFLVIIGRRRERKREREEFGGFRLTDVTSCFCCGRLGRVVVVGGGVGYLAARVRRRRAGVGGEVQS